MRLYLKGNLGKSLFILCAGLFCGSIKAAPPPVEDFAKPLEYYDAVLSPNGDYIAVERAADLGKTLVAILQTKDLKLLSHIPATSSASPINPRWISNERYVVEFTKELKSYEAEFANGELLAINADGSGERKIIHHASDMTLGSSTKLNNLNGLGWVVNTLPGDDKKVIIEFIGFGSSMSGERVKLYELHTVTGQAKLLAEAPSYDASFTLSPDGRPLFTFGRDKSVEDKNIYVAHRYRDGKWEPLAPPALGAEYVEVIAGSENPDEVYIEARFLNKTNRLYRYNLETGKSQAVFAHPKVDPESYDIDERTNRLIAVHFEDGGVPNLQIVDLTHLYAKWYPALFQVFAGKKVVITSVTDDGSLLIVHVSGADEPGQFHLFDTKTKKLKYLFNAASWIKPEALSKVEAFTMKARDGLELSGYLTLPREGKGPHPLVVMPHGGPHDVRDRWTYNSEVQFLASRGYAVLQVNFRGSSGHGLGFEVAGYRKWGAEIQYDIIDATHWAAARQDIDDKRICIMGASFGGYSALMSSILEPDLYKCAIGEAGVYDLNLMWSKTDFMRARSQSGENYLQVVIGADKAVLDKFSPVYRVAELKTPVFLAHGEDDRRADIENFNEMVKVLKARNHPYETLLFDRERHGFANEKNEAEFLRRAEAFLDKYIGGKVTQTADRKP
ncbi:MAG TPA: prolyl oligopeptidase family serine peptidase [Gammaproteobacteria bacterium]|nr:prolyl oligopeptidase family serine peptidase [Gammaproteobacteria bacterium]